MIQRDKEILSSLQKFRVLDRDQIISIHFNDLKQKVVTCNRVMKRLRDRGLVDCDLTSTPYNYFPNPAPMKKQSMKLYHFKAITDFYIEASKLGRISEFEVEFKTGNKGSVEPDAFMIWNNAPFFVEVQRSFYTNKVMEKKLERYEEYFDSGEWKELHWQKEKKFFPYLLIITDHVYSLGKNPMKIFQAKSMNDFIKRYGKK